MKLTAKFLAIAGGVLMTGSVFAANAQAYGEPQAPLEERIRAALSQSKGVESQDYEDAQSWIEQASDLIQKILSQKDDGQEALSDIEQTERNLVYYTRFAGQPAAWEDVGTTASQIKELKILHHMRALLVFHGRAGKAENKELAGYPRDASIQSLTLIKIAEDHLKQAVALSGKTEQELFEQSFSIRFNYHDFKASKAVVLSEAAAEILKATGNASAKNIPLMIRDVSTLLNQASSEAALAKELVEKYAETKQAEPPVEPIKLSCLPGYKCFD